MCVPQPLARLIVPRVSGYGPSRQRQLQLGGTNEKLLKARCLKKDETKNFKDTNNVV